MADMGENTTIVVSIGIVAIGIVALVFVMLLHFQDKNRIMSKTIIESNANPIAIKALFRNIYDSDILIKSLDNCKNKEEVE